MTNYLIGAVVILFIATFSYYEVQKKQEIKAAIEKTREEERDSCKRKITETNLESSNKTIKTIVKYEKIKSNVSSYDINERSRLLQQIEDFNFAD